MIFINSSIEIEELIEYRNHFSDVIRTDQKIPKEGIALISFGYDHLNCIMTYNKSGRVATHIDRISFKNPIKINNFVQLKEITENLPDNIKKHFKRQTEGHISVLSNKVEIELKKFLKKTRPDIYAELKRLKSIVENKRPKYSKKAKSIIAHEKDAINLVFKMFDFKETDIPTWQSDDKTAPFLKGYDTVLVREDPMVNQDSQVFGDWTKIGQHAQGAVEFEKENQRITIMNVNRQPLEKTLGVDLLVYHHTYQSYILIQYKRMIKEKDVYVYRPIDSSYKSEIKRMKAFQKTLGNKFKKSIRNYRLNNELFYFKLCQAKIENMNSNKMVSGMYIPLDLWKTILKDKCSNGPNGGKVLTYKNTGRYFSNTHFINLAQNGWIGSKIDDFNKITEIVMSSINSDNSLILAEYENLSD
jgi:hypothetical protein